MLRIVNTLLVAVLLVWSGAAGAQDDQPTLLVLGDSLSAGFGLSEQQGWVSLLEQRLAQRGLDYRVVNASISGDTTAGGLARLPRALERFDPEVVILELGGNDGLRALPLETTKANLGRLIEIAQEAGARVLLAEMRIPPNYGPRYTERFQGLYGELAEEYEIALIPFFLEGVAGNPQLMQRDGIHPRAEGQPIMLDNVWMVLGPLLEAQVGS